MVLPALLLSITAACDITGGCNNDIVGVAASPDGARDAVLFQRSCGATTGFTTQISIVAHGAALSGAGNVFVADGDHGKTADTPWHGPWAGMRWLAADRLLVDYDADSRVFRKVERVEGVTIQFRTRRIRGGGAAAGA